LAVVNSEKEAKVLCSLYFKYGPPNSQQDDGDEFSEETFYPPTPETTPKPEPANAIIHIGLHDIFIEGEYLTVRSK